MFLEMEQAEVWIVLPTTFGNGNLRIEYSAWEAISRFEGAADFSSLKLAEASSKLKSHGLEMQVAIQVRRMRHLCLLQFFAPASASTSPMALDGERLNFPGMRKDRFTIEILALRAESLFDSLTARLAFVQHGDERRRRREF